MDEASGDEQTGEPRDAAAVRKFQRELNSGTVALVLLAVLDRAGAPAYGYAIGKRLEEAAGGEPLVKQGTLYPVLRTLEEAGWLASEVEPSVTGPPRRYYTITDDGRRILRRWREVWQRTRTLVDDILDAEETGR
ncbi:MAG TPA: PadR family transcriptional regulator [Thermoanaerobaculia bacterium]|nr:PadR family transcriptional regulator [Thermoanaerobaculia bacterium]